MIKRNIFSRVLLIVTLFALIGAGMFSSRVESVEAAPAGANLRDVIINEVAWGGTSASTTTDEWIELYNPTSSLINLSGWTLISNTTLNISLTGTIPAGGYYLLEKDDDFTISDIAADQIYTGTLLNAGEILTLKDNASNTIDTANSVTTAWDGGSGAPNYLSMERIGTSADSVASWTSNDGVTRNGLDANGNPINGTPRNSQIDISLTMVGDNPTPNVGDNIVFTITVSNNGFFTATNVTVKDALPAGLSYVSNDLGIAYSSGTGIWSVGSLANGTSATINITANVVTSGAKTNFAEVQSSDQVDPDSIPGNGSTTEDDNASVPVTPPLVGSADLSLTLAINNATPIVGDNVVFTITLSNAGPDDATSVQVKDILPTGLSYVSDDSGTYNTSSGIWSAGTVPNGTNKTLKITVKVTSSGTKTNQAEVFAAGQSDPNSTPNNNSTTEDDDDSMTVTVPTVGQADLSLDQSDPVRTTIAGQVLLTIMVSNAGPLDATNVEVKDLLPTGLTYVSDTGGGTYNKTTGIWIVGTISNGASKVLKLTAKVDSSGTRTNVAEVFKSDQSDPNSTPGNDSTTEDDDASVNVSVADLSITKTMSNVTPSVGQSVVFEITISNSNAYDAATNVQVKDLLPSSFQYVSHNNAQETYDKTTGIWTVGSLPIGTSRTLTITTTVTSNTLIINQAEVYKTDQIDPDSVPGNNSKTEDDDASAPSADLYLTQSVNNLNPDINSNITFAITVTNAGIGGTTNVQVKNLLPSGFTYVSDTGGGTYNKSTGIWSVGTLANGANKILSVTAKVVSPGIRINQAEVWKSDEADPDSIPGNGSTTEDDDASVTITTYRSIIINEVAWAGTGSSAALRDDQWIELYNPSSTSINITGWTLKSTSGSLNVTLSGTIAAGGYFLLERDDNSTVSDISGDQIYNGILALTGEVLTLRDGSANFIDTANGNGGSWPKGNSSTFGTMERVGTTTESDSTWITNTGTKKNGKNASGTALLGTPRSKNSSAGTATATPIPTRTPTAIPVFGRPIINEFLPRPGFDWNQDGTVDVFDEFIEIKNIGPVDINISGWKLDDEANLGSSPFTLPSVVLKPGERVVFYGLETNILQSDGGDTIRLLNPSGKVYDSYTYKIAKTADASICRLPDGNGSWYEDCVPTPNLINSRDGKVPAMPPGADDGSPLCNLPDTLHPAFFFAECRGYGANIWSAYYWDHGGWENDFFVPENRSKQDSFVE